MSVSSYGSTTSSRSTLVAPQAQKITRRNDCYGLPTSPPLPQQGGIMPVLWQPSVQTALASAVTSTDAAYTLNVVTTQWIHPGILFRFQMWFGDYAAALAGGTLYQFDLVVRKPISPGTTCIVKMNTSGTSLYSYSTPDVYASGGAAVPAAAFVVGSSLVCFAFTPTATNRWLPTRGQPMFAIGFHGPESDDEIISVCPEYVDPSPSGSPTWRYFLPRFPNQWAPVSYTPDIRWEFDYEVVFPIVVQNPVTLSDLDDPVQPCLLVRGIKVTGANPMFAVGSWSNLRDKIAQPWTTQNFLVSSPTRWVAFLSAASVAQDPNLSGITGYFQSFPTSDYLTPDAGPFVAAAMPGQLAVVYFSPRYRAIFDEVPDAWPEAIDPEYTDAGSAEVAYLVTSPLQPGQDLYFTIEAYSAGIGGFGLRKGSTSLSGFVGLEPSFVWTTGNAVIPAGTVVLISNIGSDTLPISLTAASPAVGGLAADFGFIRKNNTQGRRVVSIITTAQWAQYSLAALQPWTAEMFVTAALSDGYTGDFPPLSPMLTMQRTRLSGTNVYGRNRIIDCAGLPGTVQAALINGAALSRVHDGTRVPFPDLPVFINMQGFLW